MKLSYSNRNPYFAALAAAIFISATFLFINIFSQYITHPRPTLFSQFQHPIKSTATATATASCDHQLSAVVHYATSKYVPQQTLGEIRLTYAVLKHRAPCNFLVFGLGHDSLMWAALNPAGNTLFLEEDPSWVRSVLSKFPSLRAHTVQYRTAVSDADRLLRRYKSDPTCSARDADLRQAAGGCPLALTELPEEVYQTEWDVIMIDAPKGYFAKAAGRMTAIYSVAVMARRRKGGGWTDVFVHDVNRRVESTYSEEFLCRKNLVGAKGRLWHFRVPAGGNGAGFC